jgi:Tat protein secretion system quality control protein TatD with DNase activity
MKDYFKEIAEIIRVDHLTSKKIIAIGKCGLDYDKTKNIDRIFQAKLFEMHF